MSNPGPYKFKHTVIIDSTKTSTRKPYYPCEGGALNAGYTDYDVGCIVSNDLGQKGEIWVDLVADNTIGQHKPLLMTS